MDFCEKRVHARIQSYSIIGPRKIPFHFIVKDFNPRITRYYYQYDTGKGVRYIAR